MKKNKNGGRMKALILIGGEGTRLRPLTLNTLKCMVPIANKHFFEYQIQMLKKYNIKDIILSICYLPDKIKHLIGNGKNYKVNIKYAIEDTPLGTAGAIKNAESLLADDTVVLNGDILTDIDLHKMMQLHKKNRAIATIGLHEVEDPTSYGVVETDNNNKIINFLEKPGWMETKSKWINAGVYIFNKKILNFIPYGKNYSLERSVFPEILSKGKTMIGFKSDAYWIDIGTMENYKQANFDIMEKRFKIPLVSKKLSRWNIKIGKKTHVSIRANLKGPIIIGDFCKIEKGNYGPLLIIGNHCEVDGDCMISNSIIWENVKIGKNVKINNSIIGKNCEIQSNSIIEKSIIGDNSKITEFSKITGE